MIKRRFYKQDHGDRSSSSDSSDSSDADSSREPEEEEEEDEVEGDEEEEDQEELGRPKAEGAPRQRPPSPGSGYEREDGSGNETDEYSSDLLLNEKEEGTKRGSENVQDYQLISEVRAEETKGRALNIGDREPDPNDPVHAELANFILKRKSVFKCRLCPRVVCLNEKTVRQHLQSKRHARSIKLLKEGRLKLMLNSDGELEEEQETHAERHARTLALAQGVDLAKRKDKGRQRQRREQKMHNVFDKEKQKQLIKNAAKRRRKNAD